MTAGAAASPTDGIAVVPENLSEADAAREVAERWGLPFQHRLPPAGLVLVRTPERLELRELDTGGAGPVFVDFAGGALDHRRRYGGGRGQPIAKAVGLKGGHTPDVLDATAGWGRDAFVLAVLGCRVTLIERSPVLAALLQDGLDRGAADSEIGGLVRGRMSLLHGDAMALMETVAPPGVIYLDPMYPHGRGGGEVKKEMRLLRLLLGEQQDADPLLHRALAVARERVVVKRPAYAEPLAGVQPTLAFPTKKHRFDVYVIAAMSGTRKK